MTIADNQTQKKILYPQHALERAFTALVCSDFQQSLFTRMLDERVSMREITGADGMKNGYVKHQLSELAADNALVWLIQVGVLRREVDGQGITDSFRLTPLGRQLVEQYQGKNWRIPTWRDRLYNIAIRWLRLPV